jgi:prevent-host-death family protein
MRIATVEDMKARFPAYLKATAKGPVIVTRKGKPVAVLLAAGNNEDIERLLMGHSRELQEILEAARRRFRAGAGIPHERFWQEVQRENTNKRKKQNEAQKMANSKR